MVGNSIPQGQVKAGDKIVNDVKLTNTPAGRFDGQLRPYSQADVEKLRYAPQYSVNSPQSVAHDVDAVNTNDIVCLC